MIARETNVPPVVPMVWVVTVRAAVAALVPPKVAVITVEPPPTAVATPDEVMEATEGVLEVQVTWSVTFVAVGGWSPWPIIPVAVNCTLWPTVRFCVAGATVMEATCVLLQPVNGRTRQTSPNTLKQSRRNILKPPCIPCLPRLRLHGKAATSLSLQTVLLHQSSSNDSVGESIFLVSNFLRNQVG